MKIDRVTLSLGLVMTTFLLLGASCGGGASSSSAPVATGIDYSRPSISEFEIGIPDDPSEAKRITDIEILIEYNKDKVYQFPQTYKPEDNNFNPKKVVNYKINHPRMVVKTSPGNTEYPFSIYLSKYSAKGKNYASFVVFATLDNIAYNTMSFNQSHTAYYLRGAYINKKQAVSYEVYNKDRMQGLKDYDSWYWDAAAITVQDSFVTAVPSRTLYPCYGTYAPVFCDKDESGKSNISKKMPILFQPIATVGFKHYDWYSYEFIHPSLKGVTPTSVANEEHERLALKETEEVLVGLDQTKNDIGWYGLPITEREQIIRYHITQLHLTFKHNASIPNSDLVIPQNGIKVAHYNESKVSPQSVGNQKITVAYKVEP